MAKRNPRKSKRTTRRTPPSRSDRRAHRAKAPAASDGAADQRPMPERCATEVSAVERSAPTADRRRAAGLERRDRLDVDVVRAERGGHPAARLSHVTSIAAAATAAIRRLARGRARTASQVDAKATIVVTCHERSGRAPSRSAWSTSRSSCTPRCAITGRSSGCCTRRTSRRSASSASASPTASRWRGTTWSRATSTPRGTSSCSPRKISRRPRSRRRGRVDIIDFVKADEIDDRFFETPYYLVPAKGGERAYALLREAIRESGRVGIAKFIMREAQHLAAVEVIDRRHRAVGDAFRRRAGRRRHASNCPASQSVRKPELDMAKALVNSLAAEWDPSKYTDQYRENLMRIIKGKVKGKKVALEADDRAAPGRSRRPDGAAAPQPRSRAARQAARAAAQDRPRSRRAASGRGATAKRSEESRGVEPRLIATQSTAEPRQ